MTYALVLKENGIGCDYTIGCGTKFVEMGEERPTNEEVYEQAEYHGVDRIESITIVKVEQVFNASDLADIAPDEDEDDGEPDPPMEISPEEAKEERRLRYLALKAEFE